MALNYNLSKVYAISDNDVDFARQIVVLFTEEVPAEIVNIKEGLKEKDYQRVYQAAHKIKPTLDLLGMDIAYRDVIAIEAWTKAEGKKREIKDVVKNLRKYIKLTLKELKKDYDLK
ncbi:Hpt domain-containing protein [Flavobacterium coralii]|uniref:Hpt domain-containing protein n=1 Tax=Flavobacterium coralii TaxID=2838017 RepID=UPI000C4FC1EB|nr:Hpt domain-containing protein [Flavobacterium coralii]MBF01481.1 histidine kinase [Flavobacterium sp.]MBY8962493.1 Hpt domain-containing protein [Flavobacterium coralii]|tara:strand:- start:43273 stop:43620 length:348 start_codon:yes stop_codon:yes gene_type:complete